MLKDAKPAASDGGFRKLVISDWKPHSKNTLQGFFTATLPSGLVLQSLVLHEGGDARWIAFPAREWTDPQGATQYARVCITDFPATRATASTASATRSPRCARGAPRGGQPVKQLRADAGEIERSIATMFRPGDVVELRAPEARRHCVRLLQRPGETSGGDRRAERPPNVYVTLNPCVPSLLARSENRVRDRAKVTTSDKDIERRRWLLIDLDPVRPADISSSDAEHAAALERARDVRRVLTEESGWPTPILADSGNGAHLSYAIELPNDEPSKGLLQRVLQALKARFGDAAVTVDEAVFNASRIVRAYGSVTRKGDSTAERPHRLSRLLEVPNVIQVVSCDQMEELAARLQPASASEPAPAPKPQADTRSVAFSVEKWIGDVRLDVHPPVAHDGGRKWVLDACPFNAEHKAPDAAIFEGPDGKPGFKCLHNSCAGYHWRELRERIEGPWPQRNARENTTRKPVQTVKPPRISVWPHRL